MSHNTTIQGKINSKRNDRQKTQTKLGIQENDLY